MRRLGLLALAAVAAIAVFSYAVARYADSVFGFFFLDDFRLLHAASAGTGHWFRELGAGTRLYRPLTQEAYFSLLRAVFGIDATGYHAVQLAVFALNCVLVLVIAQQLTRSRVRAVAVALLYAAAPGHAVAVFWIAAFTMTGSALITFAAVAWWLATAGRLRVAGGVVLQLVGLLCGEYAVVLPLILFLTSVLGPRREAPRAVIRALLPLACVVVAYGALRLVAAAGVGLPQGAYAPQLDPAEWLRSLGRYTAASLNLVALAAPSSGASSVIGAAVVLAFAGVARLAWRGAAWARLPALGLGVFLTGLLPVIPLTQHYYDYYVGLAAFGLAIAIVGMADLAPRWSRAVSALLVTIVIGTDLATCDRAARANATLQEVRAGQAEAAELLRSIDATRTLVGPARELVVPRSPLTDYMIDGGGAQEVFFDDPARLTVTGGRTRAIAGEPPAMRLVRAAAEEPPFWWHTPCAPLRLNAYRLHAAYAAARWWCE